MSHVHSACVPINMSRYICYACKAKSEGRKNVRMLRKPKTACVHININICMISPENFENKFWWCRGICVFGVCGVCTHNNINFYVPNQPTKSDNIVFNSAVCAKIKYLVGMHFI